MTAVSPTPTDTPETGDLTTDLLAFATGATIALGASLLGCFTLNEVVRRKERRECER